MRYLNAKVMTIAKKSLLLVLVAGGFLQVLVAQKNGNAGFYRKEMQSLQTAIQNNFYDKASGYYVVVTDSTQRERKDGYLREYSYLWSLPWPG